jgi:hypothetical protein
MMSDAGASFDQAQQALTIAREADDPALLLRALSACSFILGYGYDSAAAAPYFTEAIELARALGDRWRLSQILTRLASAAVMTGDPTTAEAAAVEGGELADGIGDAFCVAGVPVLPGRGTAGRRRHRGRRRSIQ